MLREVGYLVPGHRVVAAALAAVAFAPLVALAEAEADGVVLYEAAEFDQAEAAFAATLAEEDATAEELALAHLYLAALALMEESEEGATPHVRAAVALSPDLPAPQGTPLRLGEIVAEARAALPAGGMTVAVEGPECVPAGEDASVRATVTGAPGDLVSTIELSCSVAGVPLEPVTSRGYDAALSLPASAVGDEGAISCVARARGGSGAVLREEELHLVRCPAAVDEDLEGRDAVEGSPGGGEPGDVVLPPPPPSTSVDPWVWVGVGAGAVIVASVVGIVLAAYMTELELGPVRLEGP